MHEEGGLCVGCMMLNFVFGSQHLLFMIHVSTCLYVVALGGRVLSTHSVFECLDQFLFSNIEVAFQEFIIMILVHVCYVFDVLM